jgi:hypothetical protein
MQSRRATIFVLAVFVSSGCSTSTANDLLITSTTPVAVTTSPIDTTAPATTTIVDTTPAVDTVPDADTSQTSVPKGDSSSTNSFAASDVLAQLEVKREVGDGYDRDVFRHWIDDDGDGCDARQEVLIRDSRSAPQIDPYRCKVVAGTWYSPYDGATWEDPSDVDIDHVVALKEAWDSGAWGWSGERRRAFANDLSDSRSLMAVTDSVNQSKGDRDPSQWMPSQRGYRCTYISIWLGVKARWSLAVDPSEEGMIRVLLEEECRGLRVAKWAPAPIT